MKIIAKGKVYNTENPKWVIVGEYRKPNDVDIIYRTPAGEYVRYIKTILETDVPTPPKENMYLLPDDSAYALLSNFRGTVHYDKFDEA